MVASVLWYLLWVMWLIGYVLQLLTYAPHIGAPIGVAPMLYRVVEDRNVDDIRHIEAVEREKIFLPGPLMFVAHR